MEIILLKDVERLGKKGETVNVRAGFGRNFLIPHSLAIPITRDNRAWVELEKKRAQERRARAKDQAEKLAQKLLSLKLRIEAKVGEQDKLFGSVTAQDIVDAVKNKGIDLDKKQIHLAEPIRSLGTHEVTVELDSDVKPTVKVEVIKKS